MTKEKEHSGTIHLWGKDGARAGSLTIIPQGSPENTIIELQLTLIGMSNFDFWVAKVQRDVHEILLTQDEIRKGDLPVDGASK